MPLATSVITLSTASITPAQEAFFGGQSYDLKTLPHEENIWLGEQLKQQQLLVDKLRKLLFDEPCVISSGIQKPKEETRENIKKISFWKSPENWCAKRRNREEHWETSSDWKIWS